MISTQDLSTRYRGKCSSIIGINPFDHCNVTRLDPKTVINNMRRDHPGFTIGPSIYLSFGSAFTFLFAPSLDGIFFEINPFKIDNILIRANFKAKIDLYSNQCRILASLFSHCPKAWQSAWIKGATKNQNCHFFSKVDEFSFHLASGDKLKSPIEQEGSISANLLFAPH